MPRLIRTVVSSLEERPPETQTSRFDHRSSRSLSNLRLDSSRWMPAHESESRAMNPQAKVVAQTDPQIRAALRTRAACSRLVELG